MVAARLCIHSNYNLNPSNSEDLSKKNMVAARLYILPSTNNLHLDTPKDPLENEKNKVMARLYNTAHSTSYNLLNMSNSKDPSKKNMVAARLCIPPTSYNLHLDTSKNPREKNKVLLVRLYKTPPIYNLHSGTSKNPLRKKNKVLLVRLCIHSMRNLHSGTSKNPSEKNKMTVRHNNNSLPNSIHNLNPSNP